MKDPYIVYSLSKNRTGQKLKGNNFSNILEDIEIFFNYCTTGDINNPNSLQLIACTALDESDPAEQLNSIIHDAILHFGPGRKSPVGFHYPSGVPSSSERYEWSVPIDRFREAVNYLNKASMPRSSLGPIRLFITYRFKLVDLQTKIELPGQNYESIFCIWFSKNKSISPTMFFPFNDAGAEFWNYLDNMSEYLPFELEEKNLRIAKPNKTGEIRSLKKISR